MDISVLNGVTSDYLNNFAQNESLVQKKDDSFSSVLSSAMDAIDETNDLQNNAESETIRFALGESENTHDLLIWGSKNLSTFARNSSLLDAEI